MLTAGRREFKSAAFASILHNFIKGQVNTATSTRSQGSRVHLRGRYQVTSGRWHEPAPQLSEATVHSVFWY